MNIMNIFKPKKKPNVQPSKKKRLQGRAVETILPENYADYLKKKNKV